MNYCSICGAILTSAIHVCTGSANIPPAPTDAKGGVTFEEVQRAKAWLRDIGDNGVAYLTLMKLCTAALRSGDARVGQEVTEAMVEAGLGAIGKYVIDGRPFWSTEERKAMRDAIAAALAASPAPAGEVCGFCKDTGTAPWIMGDFLRPCGYCEKGRFMEESGCYTNLKGKPLAANPPRTAPPSALGGANAAP